MIVFTDAFFHYNSSLKSIISAHNRRLHKTGSIPYLTRSVFSSIAADFILIYESVASSTNDSRMTSHLRINPFWVRVLYYDRRSVGQSVLE
jgi:hypothetical protein